MSYNGEINKVSGDVRRAIQRLARKGLVGSDGAPIGTKKIFGYVCAIHEDGEQAGTIDVQEFNYAPGEDAFEGEGHHSGVLLSAIQDNSEGVFIVPVLYSEVVIVQNPADGMEYVLMYSHAKKISLKAHEEITLGVTEYEDFVETDDGLDKDYNELERTKNFACTTYTATEIAEQVASPDDEEGYRENKNAQGKTITIGNTEITIKGEEIAIKTSSKIKLEAGSSTIEESDGQISIKTQNASIEASNCEVKGSNVTITGGNLTVQGTSSPDMNGPFNAIKVCPFSGAPHCGSIVSGT